MMTALLALAVSLTTLGASEPVPADYTNGWEKAYLTACHVTPQDRAAWASPLQEGASDAVMFRAGFDAAMDDIAEYEAEGFDVIEWCGDVHP